MILLSSYLHCYRGTGLCLRASILKSFVLLPAFHPQDQFVWTSICSSFIWTKPLHHFLTFLIRSSFYPKISVQRIFSLFLVLLYLLFNWYRRYNMSSKILRCKIFVWDRFFVQQGMVRFTRYGFLLLVKYSQKLGKIDCKSKWRVSWEDKSEQSLCFCPIRICPLTYVHLYICIHREVFSYMW